MQTTLYTYRFPFKKGFSTAAGRFETREGLLISASYNNETFWTEAAPLPGFSRETLNECVKWTKEHQSRIDRVMDASYGWERMSNEIAKLNPPPSCTFALEMLTLNLQAKQHQQPLHTFIDENSPAKLRVNKILGGGELQTLLENEKPFTDEDATVYKIKISQRPLEVLKHLEQAARLRPEVYFRLDPNGSWDVQGSIDILQKVEKLNINIEYCEQPIPSGNPDLIKVIQEATSIPIAVDEDAADPASLEYILNRDIGDVIIIKPMRFGSVFRLHRLIQRALEMNYSVVFTTLLEAALGRLQTAHLASALGSRNKAHGLDTGSLLAEDLWSDDDFALSNSTYLLPKQPGLGHPPMAHRLKNLQRLA